MADLVIQPDVKFIQEVTCAGGGDLKKCYQCATCSAVCTLSQEDHPFPRKQMIEAQWGLKDKVLSDPAIWLCHNCGDCTEKCPRGARPGDVFGVLRQKAIEHFAWPRFLGRLVNTPQAVILLILIPAAIFGLQWALGPEETEAIGEFSKEYPLPLLELFFFSVAGLVMASFAIGVGRFAKALRSNGANQPILSNLVPVITEALSHKNFHDCGPNKPRYAGHLLTMWGFLGLGIVGTVVGVGVMTGLMQTPMDQTNPLKIFTNVCSVVIFIGCLMLLSERIKDPEKRARSTYFDWFFLVVLTAIVFTGFISQFLRLAETPIMYPVYYIHLVLIFMLFFYAPYSKLAHLVYRTVAIAAMRKKQ
jgi:quinone-modifying oxidoreductase subunit QmoC